MKKQRGPTMPKSNRLIKKLLNLKEDYVLDLNEGSDNDELNVLREASMEEFTSFIEEVKESYEEELSKTTSIVSLIVHYLIELGKLKEGENPTEDQLARKIEQIYGGDNAAYKADMNKIHTRHIKKALIDKIKKEHSSDPNFKIEKDGTVYAIIDKGGKQGRINLTKMLMEDLTPNDFEAWEGSIQDRLPEPVQLAIEGKSEEDEKEGNEKSKEEKPNDGSTVVKDEYKEYENILSDLPVHKEDIPSEFKHRIHYDDSKAATMVEKIKNDSNHINANGGWAEDKEEGSKRILESLRDVIQLASACFSLDDTMVQEFGEGGEEVQNESVNTVKGNHLTEAPKVRERKGTEEDAEAKEDAASPITINQIDVETYSIDNPGDLISILQGAGGARKQCLECLKVLRSLLMSQDDTGKFGESFRNSRIKDDVILTYACIVIGFLSSKTNPVFKLDSQEITRQSNEIALGNLRKYQEWLQKSPELNYFIRQGGLVQNMVTAVPSLKTFAQYLASLSDVINSLTVKEGKGVTVQNAVTWQKIDMANAKKAFDALLKDKLSTCFDEVLKGEFETKSGEKAPIVNYMFDVEIPRRVKKAMNKEFASFDEFIQKYYDPSIKDSQLSKNDILKNYFDQKAENKFKASQEHKTEDGNKAAAAAKEEDTKNTEDFEEIKQVFENGKPEEGGNKVEGDSEKEKPETNETPKEEGK